MSPSVFHCGHLHHNWQCSGITSDGTWRPAVMPGIDSGPAVLESGTSCSLCGSWQCLSLHSGSMHRLGKRPGGVAREPLHHTRV